MRIARFEVGGLARYGIVEGDFVVEIRGDVFGSFDTTSTSHALGDVNLLAPVTPSQMFGPGVNFADHLHEATSITGQAEMAATPQPWHKAISAIINPGDDIVIPYDSTTGIQHEGECLAVIGKTARRVSPEDAWDHIIGYTCGNDISERTWQRNDNSMWRGKGSDTFAPMGPWIDTDFDPRSGGDMIVRLNGEEVQRASSSDMYFNFGVLVSYISQQMTLKPGDVVWSGTTGDPRNMVPGDKVEVEVQGIGILENSVVMEQK
jgi:2-keto-4-pentenoate hydratase/2-oxohepta-3-ene-1,7-dioic acid hydratase in catechol pathway|tara:strand:+ start:647 stop:1432 length:786 start_codon:yes stop_codon:yes gene_type:complete